LYCDALRAELIDIPMPRYVTSDQAQFAQEALEIAFVARAGQDNLERYGLVLENMERAPAEDVCEAVTVFMGSFMDIKPPLQDWALQSFVQSLQ
jgi:hypothetical protein